MQLRYFKKRVMTYESVQQKTIKIPKSVIAPHTSKYELARKQICTSRSDYIFFYRLGGFFQRLDVWVLITFVAMIDSFHISCQTSPTALPSSLSNLLLSDKHSTFSSQLKSIILLQLSDNFNCVDKTFVKKRHECRENIRGT